MNKIGMRYLALGNIFGHFAKLLAILFMVALIGCTSRSTDDSDDNTPPQEQPSNPDDGDDNSGGGSGSSDNNEQISMEELVANVESAQEVIDPLFEQCETIDDLAKHLDEIKAMECVSEVEIEEETLFIILKGGLRIGWSYHEFPLDSAEDEENGEDDSEEYSSYTTTPPTTSANSDITTRVSTEQRDEHTYLKDVNIIGIINLIYGDNYESHYINEWFLENAVEDANFKTNNNISSIEKTINTINTSDVIWFVTHGMRFNQQHWFQMDTIEIITDDIKNNLGYYLNENEEYYFSKHFCYIKYKWLPLFTTTWVSESYLKNRISLKNNAIVFCSACSTLQYNKNIANIFTNKGACAYLGYNNSTAKGDKIGRLFIEELLKGKTIQQAYESVPHSDGYATLELHTKSDGVKNYCIVHPKVKTIEKPEVEGASATLEGVVEEWNGNKLLEGEVGFCWSKDNSQPTIKDKHIKVLDISNSDQEEIEFDTTIEDLEPATEYSYRAYLYINGEYQYGEVKKFNTSNLPTVSTLGADADGLSATLKGVTENWHEDFSGSVGFCWSKDTANPTIEDDHISVINVSNSSENEIEFDATIEDLEFNTRYYYCAYLHINGEYYYGDVKTVNTAKLPTISTLNADVDGLSATLKGVTENWHENFSGSVGFCWSTESSSPSIEDENIHVLSINKSGETSINFLTTLENLEQAKQYYYRAYLCIDNTYYYGEIKVFETSTLPIVTTLDAEIHGRDVKLKAEVKNWHKDYDGYVGFCWSKDNTNPTINDEKHLIDISAYDYTNLIASTTIPNLDYNTTYYYRAFLYINGEYIYSEVNTFKIEDTPTITTLDAEIDDYSVTLTALVNNWYEDLDGSVGICWSKDNTEPTINDEKHVVYLKYLDYTDFTTSKTIEDLDIKTTYYYRAFLKIKDEYLYGEVKTFIIEDPEAYFREYLIKLYNDTNGDNWDKNTNWCSGKPLDDWYGVSIDTEDGKRIYNIILGDNNLQGTLDLSGCTALGYLSCKENQLTSIDVSGCTVLHHLYCYDNKLLTYINASECIALKNIDFHCTDNQPIKLDISGCSALTELKLHLYKNKAQLASIDASRCTSLRTLVCYGNQLTSLDVSGCTALDQLECYNNQLTNLNVSGCTALRHLYCEDNQLTSLDVSGCSALGELKCWNNQLVSLDVSGCTSLIYLRCQDNQLTSLDVSGCNKLLYLYCENNKITDVITKQLYELHLFVHDPLYSYEGWSIGSFKYLTKNEYGWYYPGEPSERGHHPPEDWTK